MKKHLLLLLLLVQIGSLVRAQTQLITNGSFSDASGWTASGNWYISSTLPCSATAPGFAYAGDASGNAVINETGDLKQTITIPGTASSATFTFSVSTSTDEVAQVTVYDYLNVYLLNSAGAQLMQFSPTNIDNLHATLPVTACAGYVTKTFSIPPQYFGQPVQIDFRVHSDGGPKNTMFRVDDVSVSYTSSSCNYVLAPVSISPTSAAGSGTFAVTADAGCSWTAVSNNGWLTVAPGSGGTGNGTVVYSYAENTNSVGRTGTISVANKTFTVTQAGAPNGSLYGVDISHLNGTIDLATVYAAGKSFAYVKATEGLTYNDPGFIPTVTGPNPGGVVLGAYHFARPDNLNTALSEANHFLSIARSYVGQGFLPPALDLEDQNGCTTNCLLTLYTAEALSQWVNDWATQVHSVKGIWPVLYTDRCHAAPLYPYYQNGTINPNIKLWIADISHAAGSPGNASGCNWVGWPWLFHQYNWPPSATNDPTSGMDLDIFNGDVAAFNTLIGTSSTCTAPTTQAGITATTATASQVTLTLGAGNGTRRIVKMNTTSTFTDPANATDPQAVATYGGSGEQVVFNGTGTSVVVTGLNPGTNYCFRVYEANCSGTQSVYDITSPGNACQATSTITAVSDPTEQYQVGIAPNPSNGVFTVNMQFSTPKDVSFRMIDMLGRVVYRSGNYRVYGAQSNQVKVPGLVSGIYLFETTVNGKVTTQRVVIRKD